MDFNNLKSGASDFCASVAAKYRRYLDNANAQARQNAKANAYAMAVYNLYPHYKRIAGFLSKAINDTAPVTHLVEVSDLDNVCCNIWLYPSKNGYWVYRYRALIYRGHDMTAKSVGRVLQSEMNHLCDKHGYPRVPVRVEIDPDDCRVIIAVRGGYF